MHVPLEKEVVQAADCVIIATDHSNMSYEWVTAHAQLVLDTRNVTKRRESWVCESHQVVRWPQVALAVDHRVSSRPSLYRLAADGRAVHPATL